jgi:TonB family protein
MNRNQKLLGGILGIAFVLGSAGVIFSQQPAGDMVFQREPWTQEPGSIASSPRIPQPRDDTFYFISSEMSFDGKLVKGAPYSAEAVTEATQTLADGNRIVNKSTTPLYRDSEGRTRREQTLRSIGPFANAGEPPQTIFINDPVAQMSYVLDVRTHTARKMPSFRFEVKVAPPAEGGKTPAATEGLAPAERDRGANSGGGYVMTTTPAAGSGYRVEYYGGEKRTKTESLGKQTIEGVEAEGTRTTVTIQAGEIGNALPIDIVNERWYSSELQTVIMTKQSDPRFGETVYRLANIDRSEPDKSLFQVPADYTIKTSDSSGGTINTSTASTATSSERIISGGVLNGKAISLPPPEFPAIARQAHASGSVTVQITIDEEGNVISAKAVAGHPLLQAAAVSAAREAKFTPTRLSGQPVKVQGVLVYNFAAQ